MVLFNLCHWMYSNAYYSIVPMGNQIKVVAFQPVQLAQASFVQKNQTLMFFDIGNAEIAQSFSSLQKSEFLELIIWIFHVKKLNNKCELDVKVIVCNF